MDSTELWKRRDLVHRLCNATQATDEEASALLDFCEWKDKVAENMFALFLPKTRGTFPPKWILTVGQLPLNARKKVVKNFIAYFPRDVFKALAQGLDEESCDYLVMISIRAFANCDHAVIQREEFRRALELAKTDVLPLFLKWGKELRAMAKAPEESVQWEAARERFKALLCRTLPSVEEANPVFSGIAQVLVNLHVPMRDKLSQSALHVAAELGDVDLLKSLLASNAKFDAEDNHGNTALHVGINHLDIVKELLAAAESADEAEQFVKQTNKKHQTALYLCSNAETARLLLDVDPDLLFAKQKLRHTVLHLNVDNPSMVKVLLKAAGEAGQLARFVEQVDEDGKTALHLCENAESALLLAKASPTLLFKRDKDGDSVFHYKMDVEMLKVLLKAAREANELEEFVHQVDGYWRTALHICENTESARLLVEASPDLLFKLDKLRNSVLHLNVDNVEMLVALLDAAKKAGQLARFAEQVDKGGNTALHLCKNVEYARLLVGESPDLLFKLDKQHNSVLHLNMGDGAMIGVLLDAAEKAGKLMRFVELVDGDGRTALHACRNAKTARRLLAASPRLASMQCKKGNTPLHMQAIYGSEVTCRLLLEKYRVNVDAMDSKGQTALYFACLNFRFKIVELLLTYSPNVFARDHKQRTVLHRAVARNGKHGAEKGNHPDLIDCSQAMPILELLLERGMASAVTEVTKASDARGKTLLHYWAEFEWGGVEIADKLILAGTNGAAQDMRGKTVMHILARKRRYYLMLHLVLKWGLSIRITNCDGDTPLDLVRSAEDKAELESASARAGIVTLRLARARRVLQSPWKRLPNELFRDLCSFLV